jgi:O-methyltransferase
MIIFRKKQKQNPISDYLINQITHQRGNIDNDFPSDFSKAEIDAIEKVAPYTMTSLERLISLYRAVDYIEESNVEGDIVECGVWKGGCMMLAANKLLEKNSNKRNLFLFDTFEGMSEPTENDIAITQQSAKDLLEKEDNKFSGDNIWCFASIEDVKKNMFSTGYKQDNIYFVKGKVEDTLPIDKIERIALLRLDTDWYESTKHELETLYDKLVIGGVLIIDDYGHWNGAKKAVDEFIKDRKLSLFLNRIDYTGRLAIKIK